MVPKMRFYHMVVSIIMGIRMYAIWFAIYHQYTPVLLASIYHTTGSCGDGSKILITQSSEVNCEVLHFAHGWQRKVTSPRCFPWTPEPQVMEDECDWRPRES